MIKEMGLSIVAEGVENEEQFQLMKELGVDYIQGFYFSRPLSPEALIEFMQNQEANTANDAGGEWRNDL